MYDLTAFQRDLMFVTAGLEQPAGLRIKEELDSYYESEVHHGRLYPNLDELVDMGLLAKTKKDKRTNAYSLTTRGKRELEERRNWEAEQIDET